MVNIVAPDPSDTCTLKNLALGKCSKISNIFLVLFSNKMLFFQGWNLQKCMLEKQTGKTLIRLLLQKQSDLSLHCLSKPFWQATSVQNFRIFIISRPMV